VHISGFHFAGDMLGMAQEGRYIESAEAIVPVVAFKFPVAAFETLLSQNGELAVRILCKLADEIRRKDHHALILDRQDAMGKIAMFLLMLEDARQTRGPSGTIYFPMMRLDVAKYVGLTLETVSRAFHLLERHAIAKFIDRHHFHVLDRERLEALSAGTAEAMPTITRKTTKGPGPAPETEMPIRAKKRAR
jgi:CRP-like cAMP-binding protein